MQILAISEGDQRVKQNKVELLKKTELDLAEEKALHEIAKYLKEHGARNCDTVENPAGR